MFNTVTVGRSTQANVQVEGDTVSRFHLEVTMTEEGRFYGIDRNSSHGTYIWRDNEWKIFTQGYLAPGTHLAFGQTKVSADDLMQRVRKVFNHVIFESPMYEPLSIKPRRNTETGEVE